MTCFVSMQCKMRQYSMKWINNFTAISCDDYQLRFIDKFIEKIICLSNY